MSDAMRNTLILTNPEVARLAAVWLTWKGHESVAAHLVLQSSADEPTMRDAIERANKADIAMARELAGLSTRECEAREATFESEYRHDKREESAS
ncbi:MAG: hypothetical protein H0U66_06245 [Gemmatimonadaceae bacterium]|nr:hypothetical protein [Gemmatimonadaceae bacterium]